MRKCFVCLKLEKLSEIKTKKEKERLCIFAIDASSKSLTVAGQMETNLELWHYGQGRLQCPSQDGPRPSHGQDKTNNKKIF